MFFSILTWLLSKVGSPMVGKVLDTIKGKDDNQKAIIIAEIAARQEDNKLRAQLAPQFAWLIYFITLPCAVHFGLIVLDSCIPDQWGHIGIGKLPAPYDDYEKQILLSFFILQPVSSAIKGVTSWLHKN